LAFPNGRPDDQVNSQRNDVFHTIAWLRRTHLLAWWRREEVSKSGERRQIADAGIAAVEPVAPKTEP
jgi:hypothetical protein